MSDLSEEWMRALKERDLAVDSIKAFLAAVDGGKVKLMDADVEPEEITALRDVAKQFGRKQIQ